MNKLITISSVLLTATAVKAQSPNVIFILADDLGYGDISAFNPESKIHTPNIDNLTHSGISFTDAHSSSALSTPSRYSIITGRYPWRTTMKSGVLNGFSPAMITPDRRTIAQMFSENGYNTACIGNGILAGIGHILKMPKTNRMWISHSLSRMVLRTEDSIILRHTCFTRNSSTRLCRKR